MATTTFTDYTTPIVAAWLNDVNTLVYTTYPTEIALRAPLLSPTFTTPALGVATATSINKNTFTTPATTNTWTLANNKTFTVSNTLTFTGTDSSSVAFGTGGTVTYTANKLSAFAATSSSELAGVISDETGTGLLVFATDPTFTLTDTVTNNVSATAHGWCPKFPSNTTTFLRGDGTYAAPPVGALVYLSTLTAAAAATADIETGFSSTYDDYVIIADGVQTSTGLTNINATLKLGGAYITAGYDGVYVYDNSAVLGRTATAAVNAANAQVCFGAITGGNGNTNFTLNVFDANSSLAKSVKGSGLCNSIATAALYTTDTAFGCRTTSALTGVRIAPAAGTISGKFRLYGVQKS